MPGFNSTGPEGQGPRTGRQMGNCKPRKGSDEAKKNSLSSEEGINQENENFAGRGLGRGRGSGEGRGFAGGRGFGRGRGRGRGRGFGRGQGNGQGPASV